MKKKERSLSQDGLCRRFPAFSFLKKLLPLSFCLLHFPCCRPRLLANAFGVASRHVRQLLSWNSWLLAGKAHLNWKWRAGHQKRTPAPFRFGLGVGTVRLRLAARVPGSIRCQSLISAFTQAHHQRGQGRADSILFAETSACEWRPLTTNNQ
jgi:hypothetical protein